MCLGGHIVGLVNKKEDHVNTNEVGKRVVDSECTTKVVIVRKIINQYQQTGRCDNEHYQISCRRFFVQLLAV
jgi:hypothetical protein